MKRLLSTKKLSIAQRDLILGAGISVVAYDAVRPYVLDFELPAQLENVLFTSQNAVNSVLKKHATLRDIGNIFCVGKKTTDLCREFDGNVRFEANNAQQLADFLVKNFKNEDFIYFCSARRRDELPDRLKTEKMCLFEVKSYDIKLDFTVFDQKWDGILFFSPSGLEAYFKHNDPGKAGMLFCIGPTTAN